MNFPFHLIPLDDIPKQEFPGEKGTSWWQVHQLEGLRIRKVEYSKGYLADHWCSKGHIVYCLEGSFTSEMQNGDSIILQKGDTYVVSDEMSTHRSATVEGAILLIIDGDFLRSH